MPRKLGRRGFASIAVTTTGGLIGLLGLFFVGAAPVAGSTPIEIVIETTADAGPGSLREAIVRANSADAPVRIHLGDREGPFATPQVITLARPLPPITGDLEIDGFITNLLWKAYGVTISGDGRHRLFEVEPGARLRLSGITLVDGRAKSGAGVLNRGRLEVEGVTLMRHQARRNGGAIANDGGKLWLINSSIEDNVARRGAGVANLDGEAVLVHATLYQNRAGDGAAAFNAGTLRIANSIIAGEGEQCSGPGRLDPASTHNLVTAGNGCGVPITRDDPRLQPMGSYNGPTPIRPIQSGSPAINLAENSAALGIDGRALVWDQRGNGDPRFAAGYADLGAFEQQGLLPEEFVVDTVEDNGLRGCTVSGAADCPLRAALELSAAARKGPVPIRFDRGVFAGPATLNLPRWPEAHAGPAQDIDGGDGAEIVLRLESAPDPGWRLIGNVRAETGVPAAEEQTQQ